MPEIIVDIGSDGEIKMEVKGAKGADCEALTKDLEEALGIVEARKKLPEFFQKSEQKQSHRG